TAYNNYRAAMKQQEAAGNYFKLIDRGYKEGVNSFIEFLDARNQLTTAQLQVNITKYKVFSAVAEHERQTASYLLK
ncbi:MAG TPA: TolC family protein, partial [Chitinophagaceae bacterium]|nr:TolC family protein [Chitinophagaceae bacterium]